MSDDISNPTPPEELVARAEAAERKLAEMEAATHARIVRAELKAEAVRAGMVDLDGLKLLDVTGIKVGEDGEVEGAKTIMGDLKRAKPWLFGGGSSSSTAGAPPAQPPKARLATEMDYAEWQKARADLLKRR
jgi:hypothetical protein